ncbi:hypothetical protein PVAP13_5NG131781 [Panicum virgatum]|uniref:Uncharacterized protein n=1 Tax=Panicum virgatum TaxID=38727 RepID=A0A8T0RMQ3_PANVG|nr:hypothetical protein PVAP13_5NG131781 [Panicum virgatum]
MTPQREKRRQGRRRHPTSNAGEGFRPEHPNPNMHARGVAKLAPKPRQPFRDDTAAAPPHAHAAEFHLHLDRRKQRHATMLHARHRGRPRARDALLRRGSRRTRAPHPTPTRTPRMGHAPSSLSWRAYTLHTTPPGRRVPRRRIAARHCRPLAAASHGRRCTHGGGRSGHGDEWIRPPHWRAPPPRSSSGHQARCRRLLPPPRQRLCRESPPHHSYSPGAHAGNQQSTSTAGRGPPPNSRAARRVPAAALLGSHADFRRLPPAMVRRRAGGSGGSAAGD